MERLVGRVPLFLVLTEIVSLTGEYRTAGPSGESRAVSGTGIVAVGGPAHGGPWHLRE